MHDLATHSDPSEEQSHLCTTFNFERAQLTSAILHRLSMAVRSQGHRSNTHLSGDVFFVMNTASLVFSIGYFQVFSWKMDRLFSAK